MSYVPPFCIRYLIVSMKRKNFECQLNTGFANNEKTFITAQKSGINKTVHLLILQPPTSTKE